jgi:hypothetical protein
MFSAKMNIPPILTLATGTNPFILLRLNVAAEMITALPSVLD